MGNCADSPGATLCSLQEHALSGHKYLGPISVVISGVCGLACVVYRRYPPVKRLSQYRYAAPFTNTYYVHLLRHV